MLERAFCCSIYANNSFSRHLPKRKYKKATRLLRIKLIPIPTAIPISPSQFDMNEASGKRSTQNEMIFSANTWYIAPDERTIPFSKKLKIGRASCREKE